MAYYCGDIITTKLLVVKTNRLLRELSLLEVLERTLNFRAALRLWLTCTPNLVFWGEGVKWLENYLLYRVKRDDISLLVFKTWRSRFQIIFSVFGRSKKANLAKIFCELNGLMSYLAYWIKDSYRNYLFLYYLAVSLSKPVGGAEACIIVLEA